MIDYNPKEWFRYIFYFQKADTVRKLTPLILTIGVYAAIVAYILIVHLKLGEDNDLKNISLMHSLLGFVISMLLVFRTNTAYDRWWEGRKQWGGLMNSSRNLALKINGLLDPEHIQERDFFKKMIPNYGFALKNHLRNRYRPEEFEDTAYLTKSTINIHDHIPNQIASALFSKVIELQKKGILLPEHTILLNGELESLTDICGACERIKNTPIPLSYSSFIKKFIFTYCLTLPIGYVFSLHFLVIPFVMFVFYILASLEVIAEEIEDPFGEDSNDLPIERICKGIQTSSHALLK
ncbi:bestrophin family protein [Dyadobacter pollutisoli]|uniref:Bestrophin family protein n=1 Tax=Dyadobacter pollutisoli TaxID=2910158 RepID=A0A9E8NCY7_9BACT|nr:bestrophin family protein [Dyadobacter pollutisoli]WAC14360.1 bestrophin family protein [Dyadobacter pollutisoli]